MARNSDNPLELTSTEDLIQHFSDVNQKDKKALQSWVISMVRTFEENPRISYVTEAASLSSIITGDEYQILISTFANAIIQGTNDGVILNPKMLMGFTRVLRHAPKILSAENTQLVSVLDSLRERLDKAGRRAEVVTQHQLVCTVSMVLDAMVDIKIIGLNRLTIHEPLLEKLKSLSDHQEPRLAQVASYAYQALLGISNDEGTYQAFWRYTCTVVKATAKVAGSIPTMDPSKITDATPDLMELLSLISSLVQSVQNAYEASKEMKDIVGAMGCFSRQKGWYSALRYSELLISAGAFQMLRVFTDQTPCHNMEPFWCGLYAQLERAWVTGEPSIKSQVVELIKRTMPQIDRKHQLAQTWIRIIADTLNHPDWKNSSVIVRHKFRIWKKDDHEPKLPMFPGANKDLEERPHTLLDAGLSNCEEALRFCADKALCKYYTKRGYLEIKRLSGDLLEMDQCYINLAVVEYSHEKSTGLSNDRRESQSFPFTLFKRLKIDLPDRERDVDLAMMFNERNLPDGTMRRPRRILIRGRAGVGKTTLCKKIVHDFLHHQLWESLFDRVLWIPLRRLKGKARLEDLLHEYLQDSSAQVDRQDLIRALSNAISHSGNSKTLLLLDGLDEIAEERADSGLDMAEVFRDLLNCSDVIITARPYAINMPILSPFDVELETVGFREDQVQAYLTKVVHDDTISDSIERFINQNRLVQGLVRIPIQLDAMCYSWDDDFRRTDLPMTMTALYQAIERRLWKKDILQLGKGDEQGLLSEIRVQRLRQRSQIESFMKDEMEFVEFFAFTGLANDIIELDQHQRDKIYENFGNSRISDSMLDKLSFLRTSDPKRKHSTYHFIHLTFQEFFAARLFVRCWASGQLLVWLDFKSSIRNRPTLISCEKFIQKEKYSSRYDIFWRFVAGLLLSHDEVQLCSFFQKVEEEPRDLLGPTHLRLLMHLFKEVPLSNEEYYFESLRLAMNNGCQAWSLFEHKTLGEMHLCREEEFPDSVVNWLLTQGPDDVKLATLKALRLRTQLSSGLLETVASFLKHDLPLDHRRIAGAIIAIQSSLPDEVLDILLSRLEEDSSTDEMNFTFGNDRAFAAEALAKQRYLSQNALGVLISCLTDSDPNVSFFAAGALREKKFLPDDVIKAFLSNFKSSDSQIGIIAAQVLGHCSLPEYALETMLVTILESNDPHARWLTALSLSMRSFMPDTIKDSLISCLEDISSHARWDAALALRQQSLPKTAIDFLVSGLQESDLRARKVAVDILGTQPDLPKLAVDTMVFKLAEDSHPEIKIGIARALAKRHPLSQAALESLLFQLRQDDSRDVRVSALLALETQNLQWERYTDALLSLLKEDRDSSVRASAAEALGGRLLHENVFDSLICALKEDAEPHVRKSAVKALGRQPDLPEKARDALMFHLKDNAAEVRLAVVHVLGRQLLSSESGLDALAHVLMDEAEPNVRRAVIHMISREPLLSENLLSSLLSCLDDPSTGGFAANALSNQQILSDRVLEALICRLEYVNADISFTLERILWKHKLFSSAVCRASILPHVYKNWVKKSFQEQLSCYIKDDTFFVNSLYGIERISSSLGMYDLRELLLSQATAIGSPVVFF